MHKIKNTLLVEYPSVPHQKPLSSTPKSLNSTSETPQFHLSPQFHTKNTSIQHQNPLSSTRKFSQFHTQFNAAYIELFFCLRGVLNWGVFSVELTTVLNLGVLSVKLTTVLNWGFLAWNWGVYGNVGFFVWNCGGWNGSPIMRHGTRIGTNSLGTLRTGTNIAGTVPGQKSLGPPNPKLWDHLRL